jgi:hypothetical protein
VTDFGCNTRPFACVALYCGCLGRNDAMFAKLQARNDVMASPFRVAKPIDDPVEITIEGSRVEPGTLRP